MDKEKKGYVKIFVIPVGKITTEEAKNVIREYQKEVNFPNNINLDLECKNFG